MERALYRRRRRRKSGLYDNAVDVFETRILEGGDVDVMFCEIRKIQGRVIFSLGCNNNESFQSRPAHSRRLVFYYYYYLHLFSS